MERLPAPPNPFPVPEIAHVLAAGSMLWRIYYRSGKYPVSWNVFRDFGPTSSRFDHHLDPPRVQDRAILYVTEGPKALPAVLAEVFQRTRVIALSTNNPWFVGFEVVRALRLLDTSGTWPHAAGSSMAINSGSREDARAWSREIYGQYPAIEGIWYPSSLIGTPCVALYERARSAVPATPSFHRALNDLAIRVAVNNAASEINYVVVL